MKQYTNLFQRDVIIDLPTLKPVKERTDLDLLELVCQLHFRALQYPSEEMHNAYMEARTEMESRLKKETTVSSKEVLGIENELSDLDRISYQLKTNHLLPASARQIELIIKIIREKLSTSSPSTTVKEYLCAKENCKKTDEYCTENCEWYKNKFAVKEEDIRSVLTELISAGERAANILYEANIPNGYLQIALKKASFIQYKEVPGGQYYDTPEVFYEKTGIRTVYSSTGDPFE